MTRALNLFKAQWGRRRGLGGVGSAAVPDPDSVIPVSRQTGMGECCGGRTGTGPEVIKKNQCRYRRIWGNVGRCCSTRPGICGDKEPSVDRVDDGEKCVGFAARDLRSEIIKSLVL